MIWIKNKFLNEIIKTKGGIFIKTNLSMGRYSFEHWRLRYFIEHMEHGFKVEVGSLSVEPEIVFHRETLLEARRKIKKWFREIVRSGEVKKLAKEGYSIELDYPPVLVDARKSLWGYHLTESQNRESIQALGLIPSKNADKEVLAASSLIDSVQPAAIPSWVVRRWAVYLNPEWDNFDIAHFARPNVDLWAVKIPVERSWVASEGLGGFCLAAEEVVSKEQQKAIRRYASAYWNNSVSFAEYLKNTERVKRAKQRWGLDEILVCQTISPSDLFLIGFGDEYGVFHETEHFKNFVREEFKENYHHILSEYGEVVALEL